MDKLKAFFEPVLPHLLVFTGFILFVGGIEGLGVMLSYLAFAAYAFSPLVIIYIFLSGSFYYDYKKFIRIYLISTSAPVLIFLILAIGLGEVVDAIPIAFYGVLLSLAISHVFNFLRVILNPVIVYLIRFLKLIIFDTEEKNDKTNIR